MSSALSSRRFALLRVLFIAVCKFHYADSKFKLQIQAVLHRKLTRDSFFVLHFKSIVSYVKQRYCLSSNTMARRKITATEMARIFNEWDTDDYMSDEENDERTENAQGHQHPVLHESSEKSSYSDNNSDSIFDFSDSMSSTRPRPNPTQAIGRDGTPWISTTTSSNS